MLIAAHVQVYNVRPGLANNILAKCIALIVSRPIFSVAIATGKKCSWGIG